METRQATHPTPGALAALALGRLKPDARERLQAHVSACASCSAFLTEKSPEELKTLLVQLSRPPIAADQSTPAGQWNRSTNSIAKSAPQAGGPSPPEHAVDDASIPPELRQQTKYRIVRLLGRGGMGSVYEVHHERMDRRQALKVINPELVDNPQALLRFEQAVNILATLDHPNIGRTFGIENFGALWAIIVELVSGKTVYEHMKQRGRLTVNDACRCVRQACLGLQQAHERGIVHRDLKPQNLILSQDTGVIKMVGFDLAKMASENRTSHGLTKTNIVMGTYEYMAPEQAVDADSADIRADIYSLGCTLYYLIAGELPFNCSSDIKMLLSHQIETPSPLRETAAGVSKELSDLVDRMLAKRPADRPQTPGDVARALLPFGKGDSGRECIGQAPRLQPASLDPGKR